MFTGPDVPAYLTMMGGSAEGTGERRCSSLGTGFIARRIWVDTLTSGIRLTWLLQKVDGLNRLLRIVKHRR
jgi:hypothetical protein